MAEKWGRRLFVAGAVVLILLGMAHSISFFEPMQPANATERQLLDLMTSYKFDLAGSPRTMDNLLRGFSMCFMIGAVGQGILSLVVARQRAALLKRVALVNAIWLAALTAVSLRYFFLFATVLLAVPLVLFAVAWVSLPGDTVTS